MSGQPCGCDPEASWTCERHTEERERVERWAESNQLTDERASDRGDDDVIAQWEGEGGTHGQA